MGIAPELEIAHLLTFLLRKCLNLLGAQVGALFSILGMQIVKRVCCVK